MKRISFLLVLLILIASTPPAFAGPASSNYELKSYGFGAGGDSMSSSNYKANGTAGEVEYGQTSSSHYKVNSGLTFTQLANVPPAPTFTNPGNNYDRLKLVILTGNNASDATYAVAVSTDNFATPSNTSYVQADFTLGSSFGNTNFMTYTAWGSASGVYITGLAANTTYYVKVTARKGNYTQTAYGPVSSAATSEPSLTFGLDSASLTFSNLNSSNSYTDSSKTSVLTTSTNAYNGYVINARSTGPLTSGAATINDYVSSNASPTVWSGTGFGYTTNDSNLTGGTADRFTNGGPKYAGFTTSSPGDPVADHAGPVTTSISNEQFTISYHVTSSSTNKAGNYKTTVLYMVVPTY